MISYQSDPASLRELGEQWHQAYSNNVPFPHIVIDDFFDSRTLGGVLSEVNALDRSQRYAKFLDRKTDHNKFAYFPEVVGPETSRLVNFLNSGPFLSYMETLTGIGNLIADPSYFGGGLHWIENGGFLEVHADFNHLKKYNLERRINLLLYLNENWKDEYNGQLELWDRNTMTKAKSVVADFQSLRGLLHHQRIVARPPGAAGDAARHGQAITGAVLLHQHLGSGGPGAYHALLYFPPP